MRALILVLLLAGCQTVAAQSPEPADACFPKEALFGQLAHQYGEIPAWYGLTDDGTVTVLTMGQQSWSIVSVRPDGMACLDKTGREWGMPDVGTPS